MSYFVSNKDSVPNLSRSNLVYQFTCRAVIQNISAKLIYVFLHDSLNMANLALILITITVAAQFPNTYRNVNMLNT